MAAWIVANINQDVLDQIDHILSTPIKKKPWLIVLDVILLIVMTPIALLTIYGIFRTLGNLTGNQLAFIPIPFLDVFSWFIWLGFVLFGLALQFVFLGCCLMIITFLIFSLMGRKFADQGILKIAFLVLGGILLFPAIAFLLRLVEYILYAPQSGMSIALMLIEKKPFSGVLLLVGILLIIRGLIQPPYNDNEIYKLTIYNKQQSYVYENIDGLHLNVIAKYLRKIKASKVR